MPPYVAGEGAAAFEFGGQAFLFRRARRAHPVGEGLQHESQIRAKIGGKRSPNVELRP
jgi:hypothetical protein